MKNTNIREWIVEYVAYSGRVVRTTVVAANDASEEDVKMLAFEQENGGYSSDNIYQIIDVE